MRAALSVRGLSSSEVATALYMLSVGAMKYFAALMVVVGFVACGGDDENEGEADGYTVIGTSASGEAILADDDDRWRARCDRSSGHADVIIVNGDVVATACYPDENVVLRSSDADAVQRAQHATIVFDDDFETFDGDFNVNGNGVAVYGNGQTVRGNLNISGNNVSIRNLWVTGSINVNKNNAVLTLVRVGGSLIVNGNNAVIARTTVDEDVIINANNTTLVCNAIDDDLAINGNNTRCDDNHDFDDEDDDGVADDDELGDVVSCG